LTEVKDQTYEAIEKKNSSRGWKRNFIRNQLIQSRTYVRMAETR
jgi:hypothetical protein